MSCAKTFQQVITKGRCEARLLVMKTDSGQHQVFGWASVAARAGGEIIEDWQNDVIDITDLEKAAYEYTADFGCAGEMHERGGVGRLIESVVFTKDKAASMGVPPGMLPDGWWVGFKIHDGGVWEKIKDGSYNMFSIEGTAVREEI